MSEDETLVSVMNILKTTEEIDIDFLLTGLAQSSNMGFKRNVIRSFRNQIIQVAIGTAIPFRKGYAVDAEDN